ncbi:MAG: ankyrin repeat domain-containing protein [Opitutales bacterium]
MKRLITCFFLSLPLMLAAQAANFFHVDLRNIATQPSDLPSWIDEVTESGGQFDSESGWHVNANKPFGVGRLYLSLSDDERPENLVLSFTSPSTSNIAVQLYDSEERVIAVDLLAQRRGQIESYSQTALFIPLNDYPSAQHIILRRLDGDVKVNSIHLAELIQPAEHTQNEWLTLASRLGDPLGKEAGPVNEIAPVPPNNGFYEYQPLLSLNKSVAQDTLTESQLKDIFWLMGLQGFDFNAIDYVRAAGEGRAEVVELYLRAGMPIDAQGKTKYTAIAEAATSGELRVLELLIQKGANPDIKTAGGNNALRMAALGPHLEAVRMLVDYGADLNSIGAYGKTPTQSLNHKRGYNREAVDSLTLYMLENGANPDIQDKWGDSLVHDVAQFGRTSTMEELLKYSKAPDLKNNYGMTPMMLAAYDNSSAMVQVLEDAGVPAWEPKFDTLDDELVYAVYKGRYNDIKRLLEAGANPNTLDFTETSLIFKVVDKRRLSLFKLFVEHGIDLNVYDSYGRNAMGRVNGGYHKSREELIEYMLEIGMTPNYATKQMLRKKLPYWTPLMRAAEAGNTERCLRLIEAGADPKTKNLPGRTAAVIAERAGHLHLARTLKSAEGSVN